MGFPFTVDQAAQGMEGGLFGIVLTDRDAAGETLCSLPVVANIDNAADYICREYFRRYTRSQDAV